MGWRHLQKIEAGEINITLLTLFRFANAYGFDAEDLFDDRVDEQSADSEQAESEHGGS